ncbi:peptidase S14 [Ensifer sp. ENS10]|uniref:peptidase S14 n=1 Tax=Ensifer sp. ENS10 TaxID=2769286 RepID=UPI00177C2362|nr:peptidase S14 [Ensifer sp. ENS10]MBD9511604.1 peptidase S14 [Ensifer sp. ENS10]
MSVIVYDSANQTMTADTRAYCGDSHPFGNKMKIHRLFDGSLLGVTSSTPGVPEEFKAWLERGARMDDFGPSDIDVDAILVTPFGEVFLFSDSYYRCGPLVGDFFTVGSGKRYALGAIRAGASAMRAVEVAIECDTMCGGPVAQLPLHKPAVVADGDMMDGEHATDPAPDIEALTPFDPSRFSTGLQMSNQAAE